MGPGSQKCGSREPQGAPETKHKHVMGATAVFACAFGDGKYFIVHPIVH